MKPTMRFDILTIFPGFFDGFLTHGVVRRALETGLVQCERHDLRDFTIDRHRTVDDRPFGGGEGMVLKPEPLAAAIESIAVSAKATRDHARESVILLSAQGERFTQSVARELAQLERIVLICGRYEGVDERVNTLFCDRELSIGDYVLTVCFQACWGTRRPLLTKALESRMQALLPEWGRRVPRMEAAGCWTIRITRGRRSFAGWRCPRCCAAAIMRRSANGGGSRRC
jgi:tRNA (Guanine-1)-methyltransferase